MAGPAVQLVCFDLGGVLVRICHRWQEAAERIGLAAPADLAGISVWREHAELFEGFECGRFDEATFYEQAGAALPSLGAVNLRRIFEAWLLGLYDGAAGLLDELAARPITTVCLSNTNATHWRELDDPTGPYAPLQQLHHRWASHLVRERKPNAGAFDYVERMSGVRPETIVFYDDNADNIAAAIARGWQAVQIDPADPVPLLRHDLAQRGIL
jgi:FMN phosphatase YigB (HAD superfamily)